MSKTLQALKYEKGSLTVIDKLKLPIETDHINVNSIEITWEVIRKVSQFYNLSTLFDFFLIMCNKH